MGNSHSSTDSSSESCAVSSTATATATAAAAVRAESHHDLHDTSHPSVSYSRASAPSSDVTASEDEASRTITAKGVEAYNLSKPTAAVIGAGIAGVHVAYELADLGFDVTVLEQHAQPGMGETQYALPFVGIGYREPALSRLRVGRDFVRELVFSTAASCPSLITGDHRFHTAFSSMLHRWLWSRTRSVFREEEVMWYTNNLSRLSVHVIQELLHKHPQLHDFVSTDPVQLGRLEEVRPAHTTEEANAAPSRPHTRWVAAAAAHPAACGIDPVGWTRALAQVCQRDYKVTFRLQERVEDFHVHLRAAQEATGSLRSSHAHPSRPHERVFDERRFDVVVITAGAESGRLTGHAGRVPIVGLTGWQACVTQPRGALATALQPLLPPPPVSAATVTESNVDSSAVAPLRAWPRAALSALAPACSLYAYTWPLWGRAPGIGSSPTPAVPPCFIAGLLSLDTTLSSDEQKPSAVRAQLTRLEDYLRVWCGVEVPLSNGHADRPTGDVTNDDSSSAVAATERSAVRVQRYVRAFASDGLPIVDRCGSVYNTFICSGFGDHAADFAPGAAKMLRSVVERQALVLRERDRHRLSTHVEGMLLHSVPSARMAVEQHMRRLTLGVLPSTACESSAAVVPLDATRVETSMPGCCNPFAVDRFPGLVATRRSDGDGDGDEGVASDPRTSFFAPVRHAESNLMRVSESVEQRLRSWAMGAVTREETPAWVRRLVYRWVADVEDNAEVREAQQRYTEAMREMARAREAPSAAPRATDEVVAGSGAQILEQSRQRERDMQRRARSVW